MHVNYKKQLAWKQGIGEEKGWQGWRTMRYHIIIAKKISRGKSVRPIDV